MQETRAPGGRPILATSVVRRQFANATELKDTHGDYPVAVRQVAKELGVPMLDIDKRSAELVRRLGPELSKRVYLRIDPI